MSFTTVIGALFQDPIHLLFEIVYVLVYKYTMNTAISVLAIAAVSFAMILPALILCERMQRERTRVMGKIGRRIKLLEGSGQSKRIDGLNEKKHRYNSSFYIKTVFISAFAVFLFVTVKRFFEIEDITKLGYISFLSELHIADGALTLFGKSFNAFPIASLIVMLIIGYIKLKRNKGDAIPVFILSVLFFVLGYSANGLFSLCYFTVTLFAFVFALIEIFKKRKLIWSIWFSVFGIFSFIYTVFFYGNPSVTMVIVFALIALVLQLPLVFTLVNRNKREKAKENGKNTVKEKPVSNYGFFFAGSAFLAVLFGVWIPSTLINASPQEFVDVNYFHNPVLYIVYTFLMSIGVFLIWSGAVYLLSTVKLRNILEKTVWVLDGVFTVDYLFFGKRMGIMTSSLSYQDGMFISGIELFINILVVAVVIALFLFVAFKFNKVLPAVAVIGIASVFAMSVVNLTNINTSINSIKAQAESESDTTNLFKLNKNGKNVIVLMMDRALSVYTPYIFNEKPELLEKFDGFTYYENTLSFGGSTNFASAALFGGYEYTPAAMNARDTELLCDKQNEALKVLPVLFDNNGYDVTVCDPTYANYQWIPDLSIYDDYPDIDAYNTKGKYSDTTSKALLIANDYRNFFCYSLLKSSPLAVQKALYDDGNYNSVTVMTNSDEEVVVYEKQVADTVYTSEGIEPYFMEAYNVLLNMNSITEIGDSDENTFLLMVNTTPHNPILLQEPEYVPSMKVDNRAFEEANSSRYTLNGRTLKMEKLTQYQHYESNMAMMIQLGNWLDYLRENDVYDNTRIIVAADHGGNLSHLDDLILDDGTDILAFYPLLLFKDFNSEGYTVSDEFMTNADVATLATTGVIENAVNPFTGKPINSDEKTAHYQYITTSGQWKTDENNGTQFLPDGWYSVHDNVLDRNNWTKLTSSGIMTYDD